jgi:hypothetical protein
MDILTLVALLFTSSTFALTVAEQQAACTGSTMEWDSALNACMTTQKTIETKEEFDSCAESSDPEACHQKIAEDTSGVEKGEGKDGKNRGLEIGGQAAAGAYSLLTMVGGKMKKPGAQGGCMSKKIFAGTSAAWVLGDFFLRRKAKKQFESLAKQYQSEANNDEQKGSEDGSYQAQVRAFAYLKSEQELVKSQSDMRANLQMTVMLGYGVSFGMAIYETMMMNTPGGQAAACIAGTEPPIGGETAKAKIDVRSSPTIAGASGIMLGASTFLMLEARKQKKESDANILAIDEALEGFAQHMAGYCPDGREDVGNARCYCYEATGDKNENRTKSAICQQQWNQDDFNFNLASTDYGATGVPSQVCLRIDGKIDETCSCKKLVDPKTGLNACHQEPLSATLMGGYANQIGAASTLGSVGSFSQGTNTALGSLNGDQLSQAVSKNRRALSSLLNQAKAKGINFGSIDTIEEHANGVALSYGTPKAMAAYRGRSGLSKAGSFRPNSVKKAVAAIQEKPDSKAADAMALIGVDGKGSFNKKAKANPFKFKWNEGAARDGNKVNNFGAAKQAQSMINNSDINKRKGVSIFKVISRRYQVSGLRHLFGE